MLDLEKIIIPIDRVYEDFFDKNNIELLLARFDLVHDVVSGNKLFKLFYFLKEAIISGKNIVTYGGAYSNHLIATAYACSILNIQCKGIVNGERPSKLSKTLESCVEYGMLLQFVDREEYRKLKYGNLDNSIIEIPEGGFNQLGKNGASLMWDKIKQLNPDYLCIPVGSATTLAGIISVADVKEIIAFPAIKNMHDIESRLKELKVVPLSKLIVINDFHFGGFAKKTDELMNFITDFKIKHKIQLDFIYTGKMMFGIFELAKSGYFSKNTRIVVLHTGGLQGNP
ncbi:MAG: pyridoxal-phosphate dependent enzyme [Ferruginibacter sp.]